MGFIQFIKNFKLKHVVVCLSSIIGLAITIFAIFETKLYLSQKTSAWIDINEVGKNENYPVDMVYLWCEDTPERAKIREEWKKKLYLDKMGGLSSETTTKGRFVSNDELKYSLRSVEKYAPWVNKIYIVTDNQVPKWLNLKHPKIQIVDHKEIMSKDILPVFSSVPIEYAIVNIPNLSEHYLLADDGTIFANPVRKEDFFKNGKPIYIFDRSFADRETLTDNQKNYFLTLDNAYNLVSKKFGKYSGLRRKPHHNIDPYAKSNVIEANEMFGEDLHNTMRSRFRDKTDIQRIFYSYYSILNDKAYYKIQGLGYNLISFLTGRCKLISDFFAIDDLQSLKDRIKHLKMFCIIDKDRANYQSYMDEIFPEKSQFEK